MVSFTSQLSCLGTGSVQCPAHQSVFTTTCQLLRGLPCYQNVRELQCLYSRNPYFHNGSCKVKGSDTTNVITVYLSLEKNLTSMLLSSLCLICKQNFITGTHKLGGTSIYRIWCEPWLSRSSGHLGTLGTGGSRRGQRQV